MAATVNRSYLVRLCKFNLKPLFSTLLVVLSPDAIAGNWQFVAHTESSLSYIDNVNLATDADAESSKVFELSPGFSLLGNGRRMQVNADYQLQGLFYTNNPDKGGESDTRYFHRLSALAKNELVKRLLYLDASASVTQQSSTEIGKGTADNYSITDDRGTIHKYSLSPYLLHKVGNGLRSELRYRYDDLDGDKDIVESSTVQTVALKMDSGNLAGRWQWNLNGKTSEIDYLDRSESDQTVYEIDVGLSHHVFARTIVSLHGGTERVKYHPSSIGETGGDYWMVGIDTKPGKRTSLSLKAGDRYYGESYEFSLQHKTRRGLLAIDYSEDLTNNSLIQLERQIDGGTTSASPVGDDISYPVLNNDIILRKTLSGRIEWGSSKSVFTLNVSDSDYDYKLSNESERTQSARASWQWRINHSLTFNLSDYYQYRKLEPADDTEFISQAEMRLSHAIWAGASTSFAVTNTNRNAEGSSEDYSQNRITLAISMKW